MLRAASSLDPAMKLSKVPRRKFTRPQHAHAPPHPSKSLFVLVVALYRAGEFWVPIFCIGPR